MYLISITLAKLLNKVINTLKLGSGYTWPGHLALNLHSDLLKESKLFPKKGLIYISATNGKTTTTKLVSHILNKTGHSLVTNISGANLLNGIASALLLDTDSMGNAQSDYGVFEVDELALPLLLEYRCPDILALLNLSRDQLDRYGETDTILEKWHTQVEYLPKHTVLILDKTQEKLQRLASAFKGTVEYFDDSIQEVPNPNLAGKFNTKNVNAALLIAEKMGIAKTKALETLPDFEFAWGRGEEIIKNGINWRIMLAKNPSSFNHNLEDILNNNNNLESYHNYLFILNDNIPDGRDVSWIYDVNPELLLKVSKGKKIYVSGNRCYDMAVRLNYAGINVDKNSIAPSISDCVQKINHDLLNYDSAENTKKVLVLPNYSAMLDFRKISTGRSIL